MTGIEKTLLAWAIVIALLLVAWGVQTIFEEGSRRLRTLSVGALVLAALSIAAWSAFAHDHNRPDYHQWESAADPDLRKWYQGLMQPDNPQASCCGESDAYWCDGYRFENGKVLCTVSDDRPDAPLGRPHIPVGTVIEIPNHKLKYDRGNPTGHGVVFVSRGGYVFCYVQPGGA